jgi:hypothetical protein
MERGDYLNDLSRMHESLVLNIGTSCTGTRKLAKLASKYMALIKMEGENTFETENCA